MDLDLPLTLDDFADGLDHMRGNTHTSDPWGDYIRQWQLLQAECRLNAYGGGIA